ncbi:MAG: hypothetical protein OHK0046_08920 [Anaerolineae bacterium]
MIRHNRMMWLVLLLTMALVLVACGGGDDGDDTIDPNEENNGTLLETPAGDLEDPGTGDELGEDTGAEVVPTVTLEDVAAEGGEEVEITDVAAGAGVEGEGGELEPTEVVGDTGQDGVDVTDTSGEGLEGTDATLDPAAEATTVAGDTGGVDVTVVGGEADVAGAEGTPDATESVGDEGEAGVELDATEDMGDVSPAGVDDVTAEAGMGEMTEEPGMEEVELPQTITVEEDGIGVLTANFPVGWYAVGEGSLIQFSNSEDTFNRLQNPTDGTSTTLESGEFLGLVSAFTPAMLSLPEGTTAEEVLNSISTIQVEGVETMQGEVQTFSEGDREGALVVTSTTSTMMSMTPEGDEAAEATEEAMSTTVESVNVVVWEGDSYIILNFNVPEGEGEEFLETVQAIALGTEFEPAEAAEDAGDDPATNGLTTGTPMDAGDMTEETPMATEEMEMSATPDS